MTIPQQQKKSTALKKKKPFANPGQSIPAGNDAGTCYVPSKAQIFFFLDRVAKKNNSCRYTYIETMTKYGKMQHTLRITDKRESSTVLVERGRRGW